MLLLLNINIPLLGGLCTFSNKSKRGHQFFFFHFNDQGLKILFGIDDESCQLTPAPFHKSFSIRGMIHSAILGDDKLRIAPFRFIVTSAWDLQ